MGMGYSTHEEGLVLGTGAFPPASRGGMTKHRSTGVWSYQEESSPVVFTFSGKYSAENEKVERMLWGRRYEE